MIEGRKFDGDKPKPYKGVLGYFPRAIKEVAQVSEFGAKKYDWGNWAYVDNGRERYHEALIRHLLDHAIEPYDPESKRHHMAHVVWNALAVLELILQDEEKKVDPS